MYADIGVLGEFQLAELEGLEVNQLRLKSKDLIVILLEGDVSTLFARSVIPSHCSTLKRNRNGNRRSIVSYSRAEAQIVSAQQ